MPIGDVNNNCAAGYSALWSARQAVESNAAGATAHLPIAMGDRPNPPTPVA